MLLVAFRPEYQLSVELAKNRIFYENFGPMRTATALPHYLVDWAATLAKVQPGFSILSDMQVTNRGNPALLAVFRAAEQLIVAAGARVVAEVHVPGRPTRQHRDAVTTDRAMPVRHFLSFWEAAHFLDDL